MIKNSTFSWHFNFCLIFSVRYSRFLFIVKSPIFYIFFCIFYFFEFSRISNGSVNTCIFGHALFLLTLNKGFLRWKLTISDQISDRSFFDRNLIGQFWRFSELTSFSIYISIGINFFLIFNYLINFGFFNDFFCLVFTDFFLFNF